MNTLNQPLLSDAAPYPNPSKHPSKPRSMLRSILTSLALCLLISLILLVFYWQNLYKNIPSSDSSPHKNPVEQGQPTEKKQLLSAVEPSDLPTLTEQRSQTDTPTVDKHAIKPPLSAASQQALMNKLVLTDQAETDVARDKPYVDNINEVLESANTSNDTHSQQTIHNDSLHNNAMRVQTRHIPTSHTQKMTDLLPDELKQNIKQSLLSDEQVRRLNSEERKAYKRTQREIVRILRELAGLEAENQHLKTMINEKEQTNESLNKEILALRQYFK
ncbi:MAG: hypothetical protein ACWA5U_04570 [bacterium]